MTITLRRFSFWKSRWFLLIGVVAGFGFIHFPFVAFGAQIREKADSSATHQVPVPGLGQNPWLIESFFKDLGVGDGRESAIRDQLDSLKKLLENQNIPIDPNQRQLLDNVLKNPGSSGGLEGLRDLARGMMSKANPDQQKLIREKLSNLRRGEGGNDLFSGFEKKGSGLVRPGEKDLSQGGSDSQMPKPPNSNGASSPKSIPPPFPDDSSNSSKGGVRNSDVGAPARNELGGPGINRNIGDLSRVLTRVLPFGIGQQIGPLGKDLIQKVAGWSGNIKLPESWKPGIQNALRELNLPGNIGGFGNSIPSSTNVGGSLSGSNMVTGFIIGTAVLIFVCWLGSKWNWTRILHSSANNQEVYRKKSMGFVPALENAIIRMGGKSMAFGNHLQWRRECGAMFLARGMGEELVEHLFEVYESVKYLGYQPREEEDSRLVEALNRYA